MESYHTPSIEQLYVECQYLHEQCVKPLIPPDMLQHHLARLEQKATVFEKLFERKFNLFNISTATFSECEAGVYDPRGLMDHDINTVALHTPFYAIHHEGFTTVQHSQLDELHMHYVGVRSATIDVSLLPTYLQGLGNYIGLAAYGYAEYQDTNQQRQPLLVTVPLGISRVVDHPQINN